MGKGGRKGGKGGKGKGKGRREGEDGPKALGVSSELHTAAREGDVQKIEALLSDAPGADGDGGVRPVNAPDQHRRSPLHMAAFFGKAEAVQKLLEKSADPHLQAMDGFLPLHFAAQSGHLEVLKLIVRHLGSKGEFGVVKKHVNAIVAKGKKSALHLALLKGHQDCARFLVMKGASVELKTSQGQAALEICTSEELKEELASKAKVAKETNQEDKEEKEKQNKEVDATEAEEPAAKKQKTMPAMSGAVAPLEGLPEAPVQLDASAAPPGLLACGPYSLDKVQISLEGEKSYPAGIPAMADVEWDLLTKEEPERVDGPVLCLRTRETTGGTLHLKMLKSKKKLLHYTHFSDEALLMDKDSKCNACGLILLLETSDGHLLIHQSGEQTWELCAGEVTTSDLAQAIAQVLLTALPNSQQKDSQDVLASMRILGLLDVKEAPRGHRHELVAAGRLPFAASKVGALGEAPKLRFLPRSLDIQASEEVATMALEDFLNATSTEPLQRAAVALLRALRAWKA